MDATVTARLDLASPIETDPRWAAVITRDITADGAFVYAVTTTKIYCRPSCPARRSHPRHVRFYPTAAEAEAAGFRPCKRCQPDGVSPVKRMAIIIAQACRWIEAAEEPVTLSQLAAHAGLSAAHFHRTFRAVTGLTPRQYAAAHRSGKLRAALTTSATVTDALYESGFNAASRFYAASNAMLGMTPTAFRAGGARVVIRFAVGHCSLGAVLVAQSSKGLCAILLGDDPDALVHELRAQFPRADIIGGDADFQTLVAQVVAFVEAPGRGLDLPLDVRGTAFQYRVWQELRCIPAGSTATYTEIARRMGAPSAVRAVAAACAANPLAVAIPCHRVVRTDGSLAGYRWGLVRKAALLRREDGKT